MHEVVLTLNFLKGILIPSNPIPHLQMGPRFTIPMFFGGVDPALDETGCRRIIGVFAASALICQLIYRGLSDIALDVCVTERLKRRKKRRSCC